MPAAHELDGASADPHRAGMTRTSSRRSTTWSRRQALLGALSLPLLTSRAQAARSGEFRLALIGQCLITQDLRARPWPGFEPLARQLRAHDACFSDLEVALLGPRAGPPTRSLETLHTADPVVLDCLRDFGVTFLATSNNHAFDVGTGGIVDAIDALRARRLSFAGTGLSLDEASAPGYQHTPAGRFAVVAAAAGMIRDGGAATPSRAGVNELRRAAAGGVEEADIERMLESIRIAARNADVVLAYLHNHLWEQPIERTSEWQRALARRCIDAGASVFAAHGTPLMQGIEMYRGAPLFHGLSSFIFQTRKADDAYGEANWQSLIAECRFKAGRFAAAKLVPVQLASIGEGGMEDLVTRGRPSPATATQARTTLSRVAGLSQRLGYRLRVRGEHAVLRPD